jgi:hypothetical protein
MREVLPWDGTGKKREEKKGKGGGDGGGLMGLYGVLVGREVKMEGKTQEMSVRGFKGD